MTASMTVREAVADIIVTARLARSAGWDSAFAGLPKTSAPTRWHDVWCAGYDEAIRYISEGNEDGELHG